MFHIFETNVIEESFYNFHQISKFSFNSNTLLFADFFLIISFATIAITSIKL
jgi:hypothetical protein